MGKLSFRHCQGSLKPDGRYLATDHLPNLALAAWTRYADKKVVFPIVAATRYVETQQKTGNVVLTVPLAGG